MAQNAADSVSYFLQVNESQVNSLAPLRQWQNLKLAFDETQIWVKDLDYAQINSVEVRSIPYKTIYYLKQHKLYLLNSLLPDRTVPALLWTAIDRALPVTLPSFNHNYFGITEKLHVTLVGSDKEQEAHMMITGIATLQAYIESAPAIRLQHLTWVLLNNDKVCIAGKPMLPIQGNVYWKKGYAWLPAGFDFELTLLADAINATVNPDNHNLVIWHSDGSYALMDTEDFEPLTISSFKLSIHAPSIS
ncbi:MAG: hypothetical protein V4580_09970 [Bacteroidota bacterium]